MQTEQRKQLLGGGKWRSLPQKYSLAQDIRNPNAHPNTAPRSGACLQVERREEVPEGEGAARLTAKVGGILERIEAALNDVPIP